MFQTILIQPLYNCFIFLIAIIPGGDVGIAIVVLTLLVRAIFYPVFAANIRTMMAMQAVRGEIDAINEKWKDNPTEKARSTSELFKKHRIRPFASILSLLIQLPVFIALYWAFFKLGLPHIAINLLYPFVHVPTTVNTDFLGVLNLLAPHNIPTVLVVGALQYAVMYFSLARTKPAPGANKEQQAAQAMQRYMMLYFLPVLMAGVSYSFPAAVGLYFATSSVVALGQEWLIRRNPL